MSGLKSTSIPVSQFAANTIEQARFDMEGLASFPLDIMPLVMAMPSSVLNLIPYRTAMSINIPPALFQSARLLYFLQSDFTGATALPDIPPNVPDLDFLYFYQRQTDAKSWGVAAPGIDTVPTTWRNGTNIYRINLERNNLSAAQQLSLTDSIEAEIVAGLGHLYTSTSATIRIIDLESNSSGANDPIPQADLIARGWTSISASRVRKTITNTITGIPRSWNLYHNV